MGGGKRFLEAIGLSVTDKPEEEEGLQTRPQGRRTIERNEPMPREDNNNQTLFGEQRKGPVLVHRQDQAFKKMYNFTVSSNVDIEKAINILKENKPMVINLQNLDSETGQRALDTLSGAVFALDSNLQRVARKVFLVTPSDMEIDGNIDREDMKNNFFFSEVQNSDQNELD